MLQHFYFAHSATKFCFFSLITDALVVIIDQWNACLLVYYAWALSYLQYFSCGNGKQLVRSVYYYIEDSRFSIRQWCFPKLYNVLSRAISVGRSSDNLKRTPGVIVLWVFAPNVSIYTLAAKKVWGCAEISNKISAARKSSFLLNFGPPREKDDHIWYMVVYVKYEVNCCS